MQYFIINDKEKYDILIQELKLELDKKLQNLSNNKLNVKENDPNYIAIDN